MQTAADSIIVDQEFKSLIPPLSESELAQLEANLVADGCRDSLALWEGTLLDGHNRHEICARLDIPFATTDIILDSREAAKDWIIANQLGRRNLHPDAFTYLLGVKYNREKKREGRPSEKLRQSDGETAARLATEHGVSDRTVERAGEFAEAVDKLADEVGSEVRERVTSGKSKLTRKETVEAAKEIKKAPKAVKDKLKAGETFKNIKKAAKAEAKKAKPPAPADGKLYRLIHADLKDADVADESIDWVITDPPYPKEYLPLYSNLGEFAGRVLKPGGSLLCMVGQSYLPAILARLEHHLDYQWTLAYLTPGGQAVQLFDRKVNTFWKPVLWFVKGEYEGDWIGDVTRSETNDNDKKHHHWGQSESGMADLLERFTYPGQTICDPFMGGCTTGVVSVAMDRRFIGIDCDEAAFSTSKSRMQEASNVGR